MPRPGTSAGQTMRPTAGVVAAAASAIPPGEAAMPKATWGWSITPTRIARAPTALSAKVVAWANIGFMIVIPFSLHRCDLRAAVAAYEKQILSDTMARCRFNQKIAAEALGLSYDQIRHALKKHGLNQ